MWLWWILLVATASSTAAKDPGRSTANFTVSDPSELRPSDARRFGAVPNDGKDDTVALRHALGNCSATGGAVYIPPGHYIVSPLTAGALRGPLPKSTAHILPIPSDCHVFGGGRTGVNTTTIAMATTGGVDDRGVNGVNGTFWRMFGWCGNASRYIAADAGRLHVDQRACPHPPSNISISDLHLSGSTNYTSGAQIAGEREHGSLIFFYAALGAGAEAAIRNITALRVLTDKIAGDGMNFGDGVQNVLVSDVLQRDYLRVGVDQAGAGPLARDREIRGVIDLPSSAGVVAGNSIHIEESENLTNVWIHDNVCINSMDVSGAKNMTIERNLIEGAIVVNGDNSLVIRNNTITATKSKCPISGCCAGMIFMLSANGALVDNNTLRASADCKPAGVVLVGNIRPPEFPFLHNVTVSNNRFIGTFALNGHAALLMNGVNGVVVRGNHFEGSTHPATADNVCECCQYNIKSQCVNVSIQDGSSIARLEGGNSARLLTDDDRTAAIANLPCEGEVLYNNICLPKSFPPPHLDLLSAQAHPVALG
jgi:hypothetical protein